MRCSSPAHVDEPLFPTAADELWRESEWRNWRRCKFAPAAEALRLPIRRPYDLRHSYVSLRLHAS